nr:hypothetical protein [Pseudosulfitobacter pseudonitzschiae]
MENLAKCCLEAITRIECTEAELEHQLVVEWMVAVNSDHFAAGSAMDLMTLRLARSSSWRRIHTNAVLKIEAFNSATDTEKSFKPMSI